MADPVLEYSNDFQLETAAQLKDVSGWDGEGFYTRRDDSGDIYYYPQTSPSQTVYTGGPAMRDMIVFGEVPDFENAATILTGRILGASAANYKGYALTWYNSSAGSGEYRLYRVDSPTTGELLHQSSWSPSNCYVKLGLSLNGSNIKIVTGAMVELLTIVDETYMHDGYLGTHRNVTWTAISTNKLSAVELYSFQSDGTPGGRSSLGGGLLDGVMEGR